MKSEGIISKFPIFKEKNGVGLCRLRKGFRLAESAMANISELTDAQLEAVVSRYTLQSRGTTDEGQRQKIQVLLKQLQQEKQRRSGGGTPTASKSMVPATAKPGPAKATVTAVASARHKAPTKADAKKNSKRSPRIVEGKPIVPLWAGNTILGVGLLLGLWGMVLVVDYYFFGAITTSIWTWIVCVTFGIGLSKLGVFLMDAERGRAAAEKVVVDL